MILLTGGTGLVGSHLLYDLIKSGAHVRAIYRQKNSLKRVKKVFSYYQPIEEVELLFEKIEWFQADILDVPALESAFRGIKRVYHCAAMVTFNPSKYKKLRKTNIEGTANVVNLCIINNIEKLCFVSSIATLDQKPGEAYIHENSYWSKEENHNAYAISKYGAEIEVWRASQEGIPVIIVNPGVILGPGFWNTGSGLMFKKIQQGLCFYFLKTTGFVGVQDVARIMQQLMHSSVQNEQFILVSENTSFKTVFTFIAQCLGKPVPKKELKPWMVTLRWILEKISGFFGKQKHLTSESADTLFQHSFYSSNKVKDLLEIDFRSIEEEVKMTCNYFQSDLKG